jgi:hypothetical protein
MKFRFIVPLVTTLCLFAGAAFGQSNGVFFDQTATDCDATIPANSPATWYIIAILGGPSAGGITGAEFRQDGTPGTYFMSANANPAANLTIGNPLTGGCNIAFPDCQTGGGTGHVLLYTINGFASGDAVPQTYLSILKHTTPSRPDLQCPLLVLCDAPVYTQVCVGGGQAIVNGVPCTVAVEPKSWSQVKSLYGN